MFFRIVPFGSRFYFRSYILIVSMVFSSISIFAQPVISSLNPSAGVVGSTVAINGTGFSSIASSNIVYFGSVRASVSTASPTTVNVIVPAGFNTAPLTVTTAGLTAFSPAPFIVAIPNGGGPFNIGSFLPRIDITTLSSPSHVAAADFDNDGKPELVTSNGTLSTVSVFKNASTPATVDFSARTEFASNLQSISVTAGDVDGDGLLDMVVGYSSLHTVSVYRNTSTTGNISFAAKIDFPTTYSARFISIIDLDGDGRSEIVSTASTNINVLHNTSTPGNISFDPYLSFPIGNSSDGLAVVDVNADGKPDIISCYYSGNKVNVLKNTGTGSNISFDAALSFTTAANPISVAVGNLDDDNKPDIAVANYGAQSLSVFQNNGSGNSISFIPKQDLVIQHQPRNIQLADMNGDGKQDILVSNGDVSNRITLFRNKSAAAISFDPRVDYNTAGANALLTTADLNCDGRLDVAVTLTTSGRMAIFINKTGDAPTMTSFTPQSAGEGTLITIKGTNLGSVSSVTFGGIPATSLTVVNDTAITAIVGTGATGMVSLTTAAGTAGLPGFIYNGPVRITSFTPLSGPVGQPVKIMGSNFSPVAANNTVYFGTAKAVVTSATTTTLHVVAPSNNLYMPISVTANGLTAYSKQPFNITFTGGSLGTGSFIKKITAPSTFNSLMENVCPGDIDGDGKTDIVAGNFSINSFSVYRNITVDGMIYFEPYVEFGTAGNEPSSVTLADFDGDGKLDVAVSLQIEGWVNIFRNTSTPGNISFASPVIAMIGGYSRHIAVGDLDSDGKPDMAIGYNSSSFISTVRNTSTIGNISFAASQNHILPALSTCGVSISDIDDDGKPDLLASSDDSSFAIFKNISTVGAINFLPRVDQPAGIKCSYITTADLDSDGKQDIMVSSSYYGNAGMGITTDSVISIFKNLSTAGNILLAPKQTVHFSTRLPSNFSVSDLDGDGKPDITGTEDYNTFGIFKNTSTAANISFGPEIQYQVNVGTPGAPTSIGCADFDADGKPDIAIINSYVQATMNIWINQNPSDVDICPNGNAFIYSNLSGLGYQWQVNTGSGYTNISDNSNYSGTTTQALQLTNISSSWAGYSYRCLVDASTSKQTTIRIANYWTGAINNAWENPGNWSCGTVPDANTTVIINSGTVSIHSNVVIKNLTLGPDVIFTIATGYNLTITN